MAGFLSRAAQEYLEEIEKRKKEGAGIGQFNHIPVPQGPQQQQAPAQINRYSGGGGGGGGGVVRRARAPREAQSETLGPNATDEQRDQLRIDAQMDKDKWKGRGLIGAPVAGLINMITKDSRLSKAEKRFLGSSLAERQQASDIQTAKNKESDRRTVFEQATEDASDQTRLDESREFQRADEDEQRRYDFLLAQTNTEDERANTEEVLGEQRIHDTGVLEEQRTHDASVLEDERTYDEDQATAARERGELAQIDEGARILVGRLDELNNAMPALRRMAGTGGDDSWNVVERGVMGTGGISQFLPSLRDDTQVVEGLAASEALAELGTMPVKLTPVSDTDIRTLMKTGISPAKNEQVNLDTAVREAKMIEKELKARAARAKRLRGQMPSGVKSVREI